MTDDNDKEFIKKFHEQFPWYDYSYLLSMMIMWMENASNMHIEHGNCVNHKIVGKDLKIMADVLKRIQEDNYYEKIQENELADAGLDVNFMELPYSDEERKKIQTLQKLSEKRKKDDLEYCLNMLKRKLFSLWD